MVTQDSRIADVQMDTCAYGIHSYIVSIMATDASAVHVHNLHVHDMEIMSKVAR